MPTLPPVAKTIKLELLGTVQGEPFVNIFHFQYGGTAPTSADLLAWLGAHGTHPSVFGAVFNHPAQWFPADVIWNEAKATDLSSPTSAAADQTDHIVGNFGGTGVTPSTCVLVNYKIARRYRGGHPRTYWPSFPNAKMATTRTWTELWSADFETDLVAFLAEIESAAWTGAGGMQLVNVSYFSGHAVRVTPVVDVVTAFAVSRVIATQRRRIHR